MKPTEIDIDDLIIDLCDDPESEFYSLVNINSYDDYATFNAPIAERIADELRGQGYDVTWVTLHEIQWERE